MKTEVRGIQSISRATGLLKLVALSHPAGATTNDLAAAAGLERTTCYRLLSGLVQSGLVERSADKTYRLGLEAMQIGLTAMDRSPLVGRCRSLMMSIARHTEDTVFLAVRNGDFAHCIHIELGAFPVKALVHRIGSMRLLGVGSAAMALLSAQDDLFIERLLKRNSSRFDEQGLSVDRLKRLVTQTRRQGFASMDNVVADNVGGVGLSFEVTQGTSAAISVGAIRSRMKDDRRTWIADTIVTELKRAGLRSTL